MIVQGETLAHDNSIALGAGKDAAADSSGDHSTTQPQPRDAVTEVEKPLSDTSADGQPSQGETPEDSSKPADSEDLPPSTTADSIAVETPADPTREEETPDEQGQPPAVDSREGLVATQDQPAEEPPGENPTSSVPDTAKELTAEVISEANPTSTETERVAEDEITTAPEVEADAQHPIPEPQVDEVPVKEEAESSKEPSVAPSHDVTDDVGPELVEDTPAIEENALARSSQVEQAATPEASIQEDSGEGVVPADAEASPQVARVDETPAETAADAPVGGLVEEQAAQLDVSTPTEPFTAGDAETGTVTASQEISEEKSVQPEATEPENAGPDDTKLGEPCLAVADSGSVPTEEPVEPATAGDPDKPAVDELPVEPIDAVPAKDSETLDLDYNVGASEPTPDVAVAAAALPEEPPVKKTDEPAIVPLVVSDDDKQDGVVVVDVEEVVAEPPASGISENEQVVSTETVHDEDPASEVEQPRTPPEAASIVDESAQGNVATVHPIVSVSSTSDSGATDHESRTVVVPQDAPASREQDEAATSQEPVQTDVVPQDSAPEVAVGASETGSPVAQEAMPADPGEPVIEAADRSSPDELPVMDDGDDFILVSPSEVPDKESIEDSQVIQPVEEGETVDATVETAPRLQDQPVDTKEPAPVQPDMQLEPDASQDSEEVARETAEVTSETHLDGVDSIAAPEPPTQVEPLSEPTAAVEPDAIAAGEPTKSVEPYEGDVTKKMGGHEASECVEPPVEEAGDSQNLAIVEESEVVGSEPSQEKAVAVAEDETPPEAENKSAAAETTEELPEPQEPEATAIPKDTPEQEPVEEDRAIATETPSIPAEVSARSEETVLISQPISASDEGTDLSKDDEPVLVERQSQREAEPVQADVETSHQQVHPGIPDEASESPELQSGDARDFKTYVQVDGPIGEAVPVPTAAEKPDLSPTTKAVPEAVSGAVMTTCPPADPTLVEAGRNEPLAPQAPSSRGVGETLRADSPVIPAMLPRSAPSQPEAKVDDQAGKPGIDNATTSAPYRRGRSVPQRTSDSPPDERLPNTKAGLAVGAMIGGAVGGSVGLATGHHASGSDKGRGKKPAEGTVWQDQPQIPTRQGSLSASYKVVYSEGPSGSHDVSASRRKGKEKAPDSGIEPKSGVPLRARKSLLPPLNLGDQRADTPPIVLPTTADLPPAGPPQRPRQLRRARKMSIARAEEEIAAAVVIYASADALSPPGSPTREPRPFYFPADDGPSKESTPAAHLKDSRMDSPTVVNSHVGDEDLRQSVADLFTDNDKSSDDKDRDRDRERRRRRRSSHHHHRSSREVEGTDSRRHSRSSSHSYRHHRSRPDSERSSRTPPDTTPPRTPTRSSRRQDSGYEGEGSERSHRRHHRRSPEEQADHERRRERRLREKERESERDRKEGDRDRREDRREDRDGDRERHRRSRPSTSRSHRDVPTDDSPPKKFLAMDHARGFLEGPMGAPKDSPPPPPSSSRGEPPRRSNTTRSKLGRSRRSEDPGSRPHRSRTGDERPRRRSDERLRSDDRMRSEDRLRSDERLPRKGEGEGTRAEEARRRARQEERIRAKEKDDEKRTGFRATFKKIFS